MSPSAEERFSRQRQSHRNTATPRPSQSPLGPFDSMAIRATTCDSSSVMPQRCSQRFQVARESLRRLDAIGLRGSIGPAPLPQTLTPQALMRNTQKPDSSLWNVTRSTRPSIWPGWVGVACCGCWEVIAGSDCNRGAVWRTPASPQRRRPPIGCAVSTCYCNALYLVVKTISAS